MNYTPLLILFDASNYHSSRSNFFFFLVLGSHIFCTTLVVSNI